MGTNIDFADDGIYTVTAQPPDFTPKDYEEREIPLSDNLLDGLAKRQKSPTNRLIFPTPAGKPNSHMLRKLKALAKRAGLQGEFKLHKFRKTFATRLHREGVDARTIQKRLGHSDLETTLLYLEDELARTQIAETKLTQHSVALVSEQDMHKQKAIYLKEPVAIVQRAARV